jgi:FSR family fosmidomycin resistance protein-like MFS transporter
VLKNRLLLSISAGHFAVDVINSVVPVLLATLAAPLALSNAQIGIALTLHIFAGALSQPLFGWLADRFSDRPAALAGAGVAWMAVCLAAIALSTNWTLIVLLVGLMALGSGLFHPIGTASAAASAPSRAASATAIFFFSGQLGLSLGPLLGGALLGASHGTRSILALTALTLAPAALLFVAPRPVIPVSGTAHAAHTAARVGVAILAAFIVLVALRSSIQSVFMSFLPKFFADRGWEPVAYGAIAGIFMFTAAIGNIIAGDIADRFGMRAATIWPLLISVPAGLICLWSPSPLTAFIACGVAGMVIGGQHSVLVVHAQRLLPVRQGFAAGLILGFTFATGGIGTALVGALADTVGLLTAMQGAVLLALPAAALALTLPGRESVAPAVAAAEA